jgi:phage terminase Nu1 subunit (DNA packaging protein)
MKTREIGKLRVSLRALADLPTRPGVISREYLTKILKDAASEVDDGPQGITYDFDDVWTTVIDHFKNTAVDENKVAQARRDNASADLNELKAAQERREWIPVADFQAELESIASMIMGELALLPEGIRIRVSAALAEIPNRLTDVQAPESE